MTKTVVEGSKHCYVWKSYRTHEYVLWANLCTVMNVKTWYSYYALRGKNSICSTE